VASASGMPRARDGVFGRDRPSVVDFDVGNGEGRSAGPVDRVSAPQIGGIESPVGLVSVGCADKDVANAAFVGPGDRLTRGQASLPTVVAGEWREVAGQVCPALHGDGLTFLVLALREDDLYGAFVFFFLVTEPAHGVFLLRPAREIASSGDVFVWCPRDRDDPRAGRSCGDRTSVCAGRSAR